MTQQDEAWFVLEDGTKLFEKTWKPVSQPKAHLIFLHGFSDRSEIQYHLFPTLASEPYNIACHAIDQRGWGKSVQHVSQRGLTGPTSQVLADIDQYVGYVSNQKRGASHTVPLFLMGHSMGGQQVLHYLLSISTALTHRRKLAGAILEAPYIELDSKSQPSSLLVLAGKVAAMISPKSQMKQSLDERYITRDPEVNRAWKEDTLCHDYGTLEGLRDMLARGAALVTISQTKQERDVHAKLQLKRRLPIPVLWTHGTADRITAFGPSQRLFDSLEGPARVGSSKLLSGMTFKAYDGAYHKIHAEPDGVGVSFAEDVGDWIVKVAIAQTHPGEDAKDVEGVGDVPDPIDSSSERSKPSGIKAKL